MSDPYLFGQEIKFDFYPNKGNETMTAREREVIVLVNAYVFPDTKGYITPAQGTSGEGAIQGPITSWTATNEGFCLTFAAIDDPDPTSLVDMRPFFVTINVQLELGAQTQTIILPLILHRVQAHHSRIETSALDLKAYFPTIGTYINATDQEEQILIAKREIQEELEGKFLVWLRIDRLDRMNSAVALKAIANSFLGLVRAGGPNDRWFALYTEFKKKYDTVVSTLRLEYDTNNDRVPDQETPAERSFMWVNLFDKPIDPNRQP